MPEDPVGNKVQQFPDCRLLICINLIQIELFQMVDKEPVFLDMRLTVVIAALLKKGFLRVEMEGSIHGQVLQTVQYTVADVPGGVFFHLLEEVPANPEQFLMLLIDIENARFKGFAPCKHG